jgi:putative transposase
MIISSLLYSATGLALDLARPMRLEFAGALYHLTARGDRREPIFLDDQDRLIFLDLLAREVLQQGWLLYAFCLMDNHYQKN